MTDKLVLPVPDVKKTYGLDQFPKIAKLEEDKLTQELYDLVSEHDELLTTELVPFSFSNPLLPPWEVALNMVNTMKYNKGIGLAANQVGLPFQVFVMDGNPPLAIFNPKIIKYGDEFGEEIQFEGCLTYPGLFVKVKRYKVLTAKYQDADGRPHTEIFTGVTARVFQHEYDHLMGVKFFDRATLFHREQAFRKWKTWKRKNVS